MPYLTIISESGFPHAACLLEHSESNQKWYGWLPGANAIAQGMVGPGYLDDQPREKEIARFARWAIYSLNLQIAEANLKTEYVNGSGYRLGQRDCISLMMDVCGWCGLLTLDRHMITPAIPMGPAGVGISWGAFGRLPIEVVWRIALLNMTNRTHFGTDKDQPYPWNVCSLDGYDE